jgi:hypothetical protein
MVRLMRERGADMVQGDRSHARKDNLVRRVGSVVGRTFRRHLLLLDLLQALQLQDMDSLSEHCL